jgi:hypothetical protein
MLREGHRSKVLRRIFGPMKDEVTGERRKLHDEELHNLCSSPNIIRIIKSRRMRWTGHAARMWEMRKTVVEKPKWKKPHGRPRGRWEGNIKMDLKKIGLKGVD